MNKKLNLIQRFVLYSLLAVVLVGIALVQVLTQTFRYRSLNDAKQTTLFAIESFLQPQIANKETLNDIVEDKIFIETLTSNLKKYNKVVSLKLWKTDGTVIFSTEQEFVGRKFEINDDLNKALKGVEFAEVSTLQDNENKHLKTKEDKLIEVYYPLKNKYGEVIGVFEIYKSYKPINNYIRSVSIFIWITIFLGLLLLYLLVFKSIKNAYITLSTQNRKLQDINKELEEAYLNTISSFSVAVDLKDTYTQNHSKRVTEYAVKIAEELRFDKKRIDKLEKAAMFHDIGKIGIPDSILNKPGRLNDDEFQIIKSHTVKGANLIEQVKFLKDIVPIIKHHHERVDGKGYPNNLKGEEIPVESKIIAIADTLDAITTDRPYRKGTSIEVAIKELKRVKNTQLDAEIVEIFVKILEKEHGVSEKDVVV